MIHTFTKKLTEDIQTKTAGNKAYLSAQLENIESEINCELKQVNKCAFWSSLPITGALREAQDILQSAKAQKYEAKPYLALEESEGQNDIISSLDTLSVNATLKSLIGFIPPSIR